MILLIILCLYFSNYKQSRVLYSRFTNKHKSDVPDDITIANGEAHVALTRTFVDFVLHHSVAWNFLHWINNVFCADEFFFHSLNASPYLGVPGAYIGIDQHVYVCVYA